jgi:plastocyanin
MMGWPGTGEKNPGIHSSPAMITRRPIVTLCAVIFAASCSGSDSSPTGTSSTDTFGGSATATVVSVTMPDVVYNPNHIDIARNGVVNFVFAGIAHDVRFGGNAQAPSDIIVSSNVTVSRTFTNAGTFTFLCTLHANMSGVVVVH